MSDRGTRATGPSAGYPTAPVPATEGSLVVQPPPYAACVPHLPTIDSNRRHSRSPLPENSSETSRLYVAEQPSTAPSVIVHDTATSAAFLNVPSESENDDAGHIPASAPENRQPPYNPSYNPTNVYGRKTVVLRRSDAKSSARTRKALFGFAIGLIIGVIIVGIIIASVFPATKRSRKAKVARVDPPHDFRFDENDGRFFDTYPPKPIDPYPTSWHEDKSDDSSWKPRNSDTPANPFIDDKRKDYDSDFSWKHKSDDENSHTGLDYPDIEKYKDLIDGVNRGDDLFNDRIIKPIEMSDRLKELLGIPVVKKKDDGSAH